jgi:hypothetical protein
MEVLLEALEGDPPDRGTARALPWDQSRLRPMGDEEAPSRINETAVLHDLEIGDRRLPVVGPHTEEDRALQPPPLGAQGPGLLGMEDHDPLGRRRP